MTDILVGYVTLGLVAIGTFVTVYVFLRDRRRVTFRVHRGLKVNGDTNIVTETIEATVTNHLGRAIKIDAFGFKFSSGKRLELATSAFILTEPLQDGISHTFQVDAITVKGESIKYAWVRDAEENIYEGRIPKDIKRWVM